MTVPASTTTFRYQGNGVTTVFAYSNRLFTAADVQVQILTRATDAVVETLTLTTDYTVTLVSNSLANITITNAAKIPSVTQDILLTLNLPITQTRSFPRADSLPAADIERGLDKLTLIAQKLDDDQGLTLRFPASDTVSDAELPPRADRASKFLAFDSDGEPIASVGTDTPTSSFGASLITANNASEAKTLLNIPFTEAASTVAAYVDLAEATNNGTNRLRLTVPNNLAFDATCSLPFAGGTLLAEDNGVTISNKTINLSNNTLVATSAQLRAAVTDETGTGSLVFAGGNIGAATATSISFGGSSLANYVAGGTWTPTATGLTVVGTPTYTGTFTRIGNIIWCNLTIASTTSTAATTGTTYFEGLPVAPATNVSTVGASNAGTGAAFNGIGTVFTGTNRAYMPTWGATQNVQVSFWYFV